MQPGNSLTYKLYIWSPKNRSRLGLGKKFTFYLTYNEHGAKHDEYYHK